MAKPWYQGVEWRSAMAAVFLIPNVVSIIFSKIHLDITTTTTEEQYTTKTFDVIVSYVHIYLKHYGTRHGRVGRSVA